jgi:hypothetical protein
VTNNKRISDVVNVAEVLGTKDFLFFSLCAGKPAGSLAYCGGVYHACIKMGRIKGKDSRKFFKEHLGG